MYLIAAMSCGGFIRIADMKSTRSTDEQFIRFFKQDEEAMSANELCHRGGFSQPTLYKWRFRCNNPLEPKGLEVEFFPKDEVLHMVKSPVARAL